MHQTGTKTYEGIRIDTSNRQFPSEKLAEQHKLLSNYERKGILCENDGELKNNEF